MNDRKKKPGRKINTHKYYWLLVLVGCISHDTYTTNLSTYSSITCLIEKSIHKLPT